MKNRTVVMLAAVCLTGCNRAGTSGGAPPGETRNLAEARAGFATKLSKLVADKAPPPKPPASSLLDLVHYPAPTGKLAAYLTRSPGVGKKYPAIIWITGGDCNSIDQSIWGKIERKNEQTASAFRTSGIVVMYPSLRGGNGNPGVKEGLFGEVDDVLAAADYLAGLHYVDAKRIYLGGHSTGGTLVLLTAASSDRFRAVFSFGPVHDVRGYPPAYTPFDRKNPKEFELRSPLRWLHAIKNPTYIFEGTTDGNLDSLQTMQKASKNPALHFYAVAGHDHFSLLFPVERVLAAKILQDTGAQPAIEIKDEELRGK